MLSKIYRLLVKIPILGNILRVINSYAFQGDSNSDEKIAPISLWLKAYWAAICIAGILTIISSDTCKNKINGLLPTNLNLTLPLSDYQLDPNTLILNVFPNLLGFGIGVYALIFALSNNLLNRIQETLRTKSEPSGKKVVGSVLMLNAEFSYPLIVLIFSISIGIISSLFGKSESLQILSWFALWYSIICIIDLVTSLFSLGENEILLKLKSAKSITSSKPKGKS